MKRTGVIAAVLVLVAGATAVAQQWGGWRRGGRGRRVDPASVDRGDTPRWDVDQEMPDDVFTFARVRYSSWRRSWTTDWPDADINLSYRLHQLTSWKVHPDGKIIDLTDPTLNDYPFIYIVEPGGMELTPEEVKALRTYLLGGGFLMVDDFWGEDEYRNLYEQMKRVFPEREPVELDLDHPIFHTVFDIKQKPQMPSIHVWMATGLTYEREDAKESHFRAFFDDDKRMMVIICHNTDFGDGWEREGEDPGYFKQFAEKMAYPMAINILFYAMTH